MATKTKTPKKVRYVFEIHRNGESKAFWWTCTHRNTKTVAYSAGTYKRKADCQRNLLSLLRTLAAGNDYEVKGAIVPHL